MTQPTPTRAQAASHLRAGHAAVRNVRVARACKARADLLAFMDAPLAPELAESIAALVDKIHAPLDRIADDHRRFRERYNIGSKF